MQKFGLTSSWDQVWVVFSPFTDLFYLKCLRKGFRHCFLILENNGVLFIVDPLASKIQLSSIFIDKTLFFNILIMNNMTILKTSFFDITKTSWKFGIFTCVQVIKRILGIYNFRIITPYQLYKFLIK